MTAARTATRGALPAGEPVQSFDEYVAHGGGQGLDNARAPGARSLSGCRVKRIGHLTSKASSCAAPNLSAQGTGCRKQLPLLQEPSPI